MASLVAGDAEQPPKIAKEWSWNKELLIKQSDITLQTATYISKSKSILYDNNKQ